MSCNLQIHAGKDDRLIANRRGEPRILSTATAVIPPCFWPESIIAGGSRRIGFRIRPGMAVWEFCRAVTPTRDEPDDPTGRISIPGTSAQKTSGLESRPTHLEGTMSSLERKTFRRNSTWQHRPGKTGSHGQERSGVAAGCQVYAMPRQSNHPNAQSSCKLLLSVLSSLLSKRSGTCLEFTRISRTWSPHGCHIRRKGLSRPVGGAP